MATRLPGQRQHLNSQSETVLDSVDVLREAGFDSSLGKPIEIGQWLTLEKRVQWDLLRHQLKPGAKSICWAVTLLSYGCAKPFLETPRRGRHLLSYLVGIKSRNLHLHLRELNAAGVLRIDERDDATRYQMCPVSAKWRSVELENAAAVNEARLAMEIARGQRIMEAVIPAAVKGFESMLEAVETISSLKESGDESEIQTNGVVALADEAASESEIRTKCPSKQDEKSEIQTNGAPPFKALESKIVQPKL